MRNIPASDIKKAYRDQLMELKPNVMVTHNFWGKYRTQTMQNRMRQFYNGIQRKVFGRDWAMQRDRPWPIAFGFREHPDSNPHYHVLVSACSELTRGLVQFGPSLWQSLARHGQLDVRTFAAGKKDPIIYGTKGLTYMGAVDDVFIYADTRRAGTG